MGCTIGYGIGAIGEGIGSCRRRRDLQRGGVMGRRYGPDDRKLVRYYQKSKRQKTSLHYDRLCVVRRFHRDGVF